MDSDFVFIRDTIARARRGGHLTEEAKLVIAGRVEYAVQRGDVTPAQGDRLLDLLAPGFRQRFGETLAIALTGEPDNETTIRPVAGVHG